jgi:hypothetical protein
MADNLEFISKLQMAREAFIKFEIQSGVQQPNPRQTTWWFNRFYTFTTVEWKDDIPMLAKYELLNSPDGYAVYKMIKARTE